MLSHGNLFLDQITSSQNIIFAVGCYIHSATKSIHEQALPLLASLYKSKPHVAKYLFTKGACNVTVFRKIRFLIQVLFATNVYTLQLALVDPYKSV